MDLDFWILKKLDEKKLLEDLKSYLNQFYYLKDAAFKFYTLLLELKSKEYPRSLKIEIRKEQRKIKTELAIVYSKYSNKQILLRVVSLENMMKFKVDAFLERKEIRDVFDIEFLFKRGVELDIEQNKLIKLLKLINSLTKKDYSVKLVLC